MDFEIYLADAIQLVDAWELSEKDFAQAVNDQARLMCGLNLEPSVESSTDLPFASLRF
jgi:hypothetical protein